MRVGGAVKSVSVLRAASDGDRDGWSCLTDDEEPDGQTEDLQPGEPSSLIQLTRCHDESVNTACLNLQSQA